MPDSGGAFFSQDDGDNIETKRAVLDLMRSEKIPGGAEHTDFLGGSNSRLGRAEVFVRPRLDLDKNERPIIVDHHPVDLTCLASEIARERFKAFAFKKSLATFLTPSAEQFRIR
jgi:hypothetical protein